MIPAIAFIPVIVAGFTSLIGWVSLFVATKLSSTLFKLGVVTFIVATFLILFSAFASAIFNLVDAVADAAPSLPPDVVIASSWILPPNTQQFLSGILSILTFKLVFNQKDRILDLYSRVSS